jgi:hypothetical protein
VSRLANAKLPHRTASKHEALVFLISRRIRSTCSWSDLHALLTRDNLVGMLKTMDKAEVMVLPMAVRDAASSTAELIFAGFIASMVAGDFVRQVRSSRHLRLPFSLLSMSEAAVW